LGPWCASGHVYIELLSAAVSPRAILDHPCGLCALGLTCALIFWFSGDVTIGHYQREVIDVRSFDMPRWLPTASIPLSFGLMTIEFARFLLGLDSMHTGRAGIHE